MLGAAGTWEALLSAAMAAAYYRGPVTAAPLRMTAYYLRSAAAGGSLSQRTGYRGPRATACLLVPLRWREDCRNGKTREFQEHGSCLAHVKLETASLCPGTFKAQAANLIGPVGCRFHVFIICPRLERKRS